MKDTSFYNQESAQYSSKRYPSVETDYTQFFFNRRLSIAKKFVARILREEPEKCSLLELGCADGIVVREFGKTFPGRFSALIGIDVSPGMVEEAQRQNTQPEARFVLRSAYEGKSLVDIVNETGVINYAGFDSDLAFVSLNLKEKGWYVLSVAGTDSLRNRLKGESGFVDFRTYGEYEKLLREKFDIVAVEGCGFFIPHLWKVPVFARTVQRVIDPVCGKLLANWCHEKVFLLRKK